MAAEEEDGWLVCPAAFCPASDWGPSLALSIYSSSIPLWLYSIERLALFLSIASVHSSCAMMMRCLLKPHHADARILGLAARSGSCVRSHDARLARLAKAACSPSRFRDNQIERLRSNPGSECPHGSRSILTQCLPRATFTQSEPELVSGVLEGPGLHEGWHAWETAPCNLHATMHTQDSGPRRSESLLLAYVASSASSLLAAQCFVESVVEAYLSGQSYNSIQMDIKLATLGSSSNESDDVLPAWVALVILTLQELGVASASELVESDASEDQARFLQGMRGFVQQSLKMYDQGYTLERLRSLQSTVQREQGGAAALVMQEYTRMTLLTVEVAAASGLPCSRGPLTESTSISAPTGYTTAFQPPGSSSFPGPLVPERRAVALWLLISFMGAALGSSYSMQKFVQVRGPGRCNIGVGGSRGDFNCSFSGGMYYYLLSLLLSLLLGLPLGLLPNLAAPCNQWGWGFREGATPGAPCAHPPFHSPIYFSQATLQAYCNGWSASEIFRELQDRDFMQSGGLVPVSMPSTVGLGGGPQAANPASQVRAQSG